MKQLRIEPTSNSPLVLLDRNQSIFRFEGRCFPSDVVSFFDPVLFWIQAYVRDPNPETVIDFRLNYISSNSLKQVLIILKNLMPLRETHKIRINWYRNTLDEDMQERGEFLMESTGFDFEFIDEED